MLTYPRKKQATADIVLVVPLVKKDGTNAAGLNTATLSTKIIKPDGTALVGYTEATFTEPGGDGVYVCVFAANAAVKAFTSEDCLYSVILDSSTADVEPTPIELPIVTRLPWELALGTVADAIKAQTDNLAFIGGNVKSAPQVVNVGVVEDQTTEKDLLRALLALIAGLTTGANTGTIRYRNRANTKDRLTITVDGSSNRTATALDGSD